MADAPAMYSPVSLPAFPCSVMHPSGFAQLGLQDESTIPLLTPPSCCAVQWDEKTRRKVLLAVLSRQQEVVQTLADIQLELHR